MMFDEEADGEGVVNVPDSLLGLLPRRGHLTTSSLLWIVLLGKPSCTIVREFWENLQMGLTSPPEFVMLQFFKTFSKCQICQQKKQYVFSLAWSLLNTVHECFMDHMHH